MKQFYKENRVFSILMIVVAVCLLLIIGITLKYFIFMCYNMGVYKKCQGKGETQWILNSL